MIGAVLQQAEDLLETMQVAHAGPRHVGRLVAHDGGMLEVTGFNRPMGSGARVIAADGTVARAEGSEEHKSEAQALMRLSYAGFCLKKTTQHQQLPRIYQNCAY